MNALPLFHYRLAQPGYSAYPGAHPGQTLGSGQLFKRHEPLLASPDPRRIDLRASFLDPFQHYRVRAFQQHSKLAVYVIADLSASMAGRREALADFVAAAAQSAMQLGDSFGFIGCGERLDRHWLLPAGLGLQPAQDLSRRLRGAVLQGGADALQQVAPLLPSRRALLFLYSDCHFGLDRLRRILQPLAAHAVVPLLPWQADQAEKLPDWGLLRLQDAESGRRQTLWMRPSLKRRLIEAALLRQTALQHVFRSFGMEALFVGGAYSNEPLNRYFLQRAL